MLKLAESMRTVEPAAVQVMVGRFVVWPMPMMEMSVFVPRLGHASAPVMLSV